MSKAIQQIRAFCYGCACLTLLGFLFVFGPLVAIFLWNVIADSAAR
jgi:hypothetical protein